MYRMKDEVGDGGKRPIGPPVSPGGQPEHLRRAATAEPDRLRRGFIAEELEQIAPDLVVHGDHADPLTPKEFVGIDMMPLIAWSVQGIQELAAQVEALEARIPKPPSPSEPPKPPTPPTGP
jgi:hypothetical protein